MADKAYSSAAHRAYLRKRGITAVIPVKEDQKKHRHARGSGLVCAEPDQGGPPGAAVGRGYQVEQALAVRISG